MAGEQVEFRIDPQADMTQLRKQLLGLLSRGAARKVKGGSTVTLPNNQMLRRRRPQLEKLGTFVAPTVQPAPRPRTVLFTARHDLNEASLRQVRKLLGHIVTSSTRPRTIQPGESVSLQVGLRFTWHKSKLEQYGRLH